MAATPIPAGKRKKLPAGIVAALAQNTQPTNAKSGVDLKAFIDAVRAARTMQQDSRDFI